MALNLLARKLTSSLNYLFSNTFRYQFVLSSEKVTIPEFEHRRIGNRNLYSCPDLPVCEIRSQTGEVIGLLLGHAVDRDGVFLKEYVTVPISKRSAHAIETVQDFLAGLAGRHIAIIHLPGPHNVSRVYVDTTSSLGVVFDPVSKLVASSLLLCLNRDIDPDEHFGLPGSVYSCQELSQFLPPRNPELSDGGFNFGHTADRHVRRLLPNHYLDLNNFGSHRHWPMHSFSDDLELGEAADIIVKRLTQIQTALFTNLDGYFAISGGRDSRILLACAPDADASRMQLYCYATNWMGTLDVKVAKTMAKAVGQELIAQIPPDGPKGSFFPRRKRSNRYAQRYALSTGLLGNGDDWWRRGYAKALDNGSIWVRGNFLEILTARFWPPVDLGFEKSLPHIMSRIGLGIGDEKDRARKQQWLLDWVKSFNVPIDKNLHDFSYQELALGSTQPTFYGFNEQFYLGPASDRLVFETAMRVPAKARKNSELYDEVIKRSRQDLHDLPLAKQMVFLAKNTEMGPEELLDQKLEAYHAKHDIPA